MNENKLTKEALTAFAAQNRERFESLLRDFVERQSVSVDPTQKPAIAACVTLACDTIKAFGGVPSVLETGGHPIVHGVWGDDASRPTVTVYNHLDVQPASKETEPWETEPFVFTKKGDRYFGRGTTDDKGPALSALFGAKAALDAGVPVNVRFLWEFEEEIGSPSFRRASRRARKSSRRTRSSSRTRSGSPAASRPPRPGLSGLQGMLFTLETGTTDQHSGVTGGAARNPMAELMQVVAECFDAKTGKVKIPGFYKDVVPPTKAELEDFKRSGFTVAGFKKDHLFKSIRTNDALDVMKRIWAHADVRDPRASSAATRAPASRRSSRRAPR